MIKINKTEDKKEYFKNYRENNLKHMQALERNKYYKKKYNLTEEFINDFGEFSGDAYKIIKEFNKLKELSNNNDLCEKLKKLLE